MFQIEKLGNICREMSRKILKSFKNLTQLSVNMYGRGSWPEVEMSLMLKCLNTKEIEKTHQIKRYYEYVHFLKKKEI